MSEGSTQPAARGRRRQRSPVRLEPGLAGRRLRRALGWARAGALIALGLAGLALSVSWLADEPVRRLIERRMNESLQGYRVELGRVDLRPFGFGMDVQDLVVSRSDHPEPPVAHLTEISASVAWRALLRGAVVADVVLDRPIVHVDRPQLVREVRDEVPLHERGWQDAVRAMIPLEIDEVLVRDGELTYADAGPFEPLRLTAIQARSANIRNIHSREREYPSELQVDATVFEQGRLAVRGRADFLARPVPAVSVDVELESIALDYFRPILERHHFTVRDGLLALSGELEMGRTIRTFRLRELVLQDLEGDYLRTPASEAKEPQLARETARAAREAAQRPELRLRADRIELRDAEIGVVNRAAPQAYRLFLSHADLELQNFSNRFSEGPGRARLRGRFMGVGSTEAEASFQPERSGPEFDLEVRIVDTQLPALNELLRAHGRLDVAAGLFSLYSEIHVEDGRIEGYVKPLFREVRVHDPEQDRRDSLVREAYESLLGGVGELLENQARDEVATRTELRGPLDDPETSTWELLASLLENAFFESILPGFDREVLRSSRAE